MQTQADLLSPMCPNPVRVLESTEEIPGCMTIRIEADAACKEAIFAPGQFYMVYVFGHGEVPISVSGDPAKPDELSFTVMNVGSVTQALCRVKPGDVIGLRGPFGSTWPVEALHGRDVIVMAGGLGLAPLRPMIYEMINNRNDYAKLALLYGTRQPQTRVFSHEMDKWRQEALIDVEVVVDAAGRDWSGKVGVVTDLLAGRNIDPGQTSALICGPEVMMRFSAYALLDLGVAAENIYVSMERNMKCAVKMCGRCQYGPFFICADGPVFSFDRLERFFKVRKV